MAQFRRIGSRLGEDRTAVAIASSHLTLGNDELARRLAQDAIEVAGMINHRRTLAEALNVLAPTLHILSDAPAARRSCTQARSLAAEMGYLNGEIEALLQLAAAECELDGLSMARRYVTEATALIERSGFGLHHGTAMLHLAMIELDEGAVEAAEQTCRTAVARYEWTGQRTRRAAAQALLERIIAARAQAHRGPEGTADPAWAETPSA